MPHTNPTHTTSEAEQAEAPEMMEGNTAGIEPSDVVIELETLSPQERENILWETANSTDTESLREVIQEAIALFEGKQIEDKQNEQNTEVVHISSDLVQRVKAARDNTVQDADASVNNSVHGIK